MRRQNGNIDKHCVNRSVMSVVMRGKLASAFFFFLLHAAKVRSSCEEGPGQSALQSAYHDPHLDVTELKTQQNNVVIQAKICKQTN